MLVYINTNLYFIDEKGITIFEIIHFGTTIFVPNSNRRVQNTLLTIRRWFLLFSKPSMFLRLKKYERLWIQ